MNKILQQLFFGFLIWLIAFVIGFLIWPLHNSMLPLFKSIMVVIGTLTGVFFTVLYFRKISANFLQNGITLGIIWFGVNIILDLLVLVWAFKTPMFDYCVDIGTRYLMIPIITIGFGYILAYKKSNGNHL